MKWEIMAKHFEKSIDWPVVQDFKSQLDAAYGELAGIAEDDESKKEEIEGRIGGLQYAITQVIFKEYDKLPADEKEEFDQKVGINRHAMPEFGQGKRVAVVGTISPPSYGGNTAQLVMPTISSVQSIELFE